MHAPGIIRLRTRTDATTTQDRLIRELLRTIRENIDSSKAKDHDGKTAFTLMIETPNADIECINELLLNFLPIDPSTEEWVSPEGWKLYNLYCHHAS